MRSSEGITFPHFQFQRWIMSSVCVGQSPSAANIKYARKLDESVRPW